MGKQQTGDKDARPRTLLIWGDTQVGKTTFLASAFYREEGRPAGIDHRASAKALGAELFPHWKRMSTGRLTIATAKDQVDLDLILRDGSPLRIRDVRGGLIRNAEDAGIMRMLTTADTFLFMIEWRASDIAYQLGAIDGAWNFCADKPRALVFTKCERYLNEEDPAWDGQAGWWRSHSWLSTFRDKIARFGDAVWPTSSFGYDPESGQPALLLDEFGGVFPFRIAPRGVIEPLEWLIGADGIGA